MRAAAVATTQTIELTFPSADRFALSRVAATAAFIVTVMALAFVLRAASLSTYGFSEDEINLTIASVNANPSATENAISRLRFRPTLGIGIHLVLVEGMPMLPPDRVPTLVGDDGRFHGSWLPFIVACLTGRIAMEAVDAELTAQREYAPAKVHLVFRGGSIGATTI